MSGNPVDPALLTEVSTTPKTEIEITAKSLLRVTIAALLIFLVVKLFPLILILLLALLISVSLEPVINKLVAHAPVISNYIFTGISEFLLIIIFLIYLLFDEEKAYRWFKDFFTATTRAKLQRTSNEVSEVILGYVIGQAVTSLIGAVYVRLSETAGSVFAGGPCRINHSRQPGRSFRSHRYSSHHGLLFNYRKDLARTLSRPSSRRKACGRA